MAPACLQAPQRLILPLALAEMAYVMWSPTCRLHHAENAEYNLKKLFAPLAEKILRIISGCCQIPDNSVSSLPVVYSFLI
jgi:hypothetical protein